jgi:hypothetical protein
MDIKTDFQYFLVVLFVLNIKNHAIKQTVGKTQACSTNTTNALWMLSIITGHLSKERLLSQGKFKGETL